MRISYSLGPWRASSSVFVLATRCSKAGNATVALATSDNISLCLVRSYLFRRPAVLILTFDVLDRFVSGRIRPTGSDAGEHRDKRRARPTDEARSRLEAAQ